MKRAAAIVRRRSLAAANHFGPGPIPGDVEGALYAAMAEIEQDADIMQREGR